MTKTPDKKRPRRRRRRGQATAPLKTERVLDLARPSDQPLSEAEVREAIAHLAFLRRFKKHLRLSLNAAEDLLVNGVRPPSERGVLKHLLSKVDRQVVEQALVREPLASELNVRATFLAGVVRLRPEHDTLLAYLEAVSRTADRRDAAAAFQLTIERMNFSDASGAELARIVALVNETFRGAERTRAYLGLLAAKTFVGAWSAARDRIDDTIVAALSPLDAAYGVVARNEPVPIDEQKRHLIERGIRAWLDAPPAILDSYPVATRGRLAEVALDILGGAPPKSLTSLVNGLPRDGDLHRRVGLVYAGALARAKDPARALSVVRQIAEAHPRDRHIRRIEEALAWPMVGPVVVEPTRRSTARAFFLTEARFGWARTAAPEHAGRLAAETRLMLDLLVPGVATVIDHGLAKDGTAYVFLLADGYSLDEERQSPKLEDALARADTAVRLMRTLAAFGIELPDVDTSRFVARGPNLTLLDLRAARACEPASAAIGNGQLAQTIAQRVLSIDGALRPDLPDSLQTRLTVRSPLAVLARAMAVARADVGR